MASPSRKEEVITQETMYELLEAYKMEIRQRKTSHVYSELRQTL